MAHCPVCSGSSANAFIELLNLPIYCNLLWDDRQAACDCPKGDIRLVFCDRCGAITNTAFDSSKLGYSQDYENSLHYSSRFQAYAQELAQRLIEKHDLHNKTIIEIGCGKGDFLVSLCELGNNSGIGFDNSYAERSEHQALGSQIKFIQDFYSEKYAEYQGDLVCCRQVLEHIQQPANLLEPLYQTLTVSEDVSAERPSNTAVFFEVPNALYTFGNMMIWDIIYEHCTYFAPVSLTYAFNAAGYETSPVIEEFGGQFISIEAYPQIKTSASAPPSTPVNPKALAELATDIARFKIRFRAQKEQWQASLSEIFEQGKKVVIWGSGSKGVTFLNLLNLQNEVEYAVDINPRKHHKFIPGTGQKIVPPNHMAIYQPDVVIVMNPLYQQEIQETLSQMDLHPQLLTTESFS